MIADVNRHLLFGLIALQVGLIDQAQLVAAFQAWARDKARPLADHLADRGGPDAEGRAAVEAMVALHVKTHGGDPEKSLASIPAGRSTRERLAALGDSELSVTLAHLTNCGSTEPDGDLTTTYSVGSATSDGQRFRVLRPHARGGLGAVFVALDGELHREVALKQILESHADDPVSRQRFVLEAEITGGLEHPGIVPVYGLGAYRDGRPYYAMRFIRGDSLKEAIDRFHKDEALKTDPGRRSLEQRKLLRRFTDVCNAIDYAHSRGVLHRDIKPGNVIVGKHGETLVVDWGLAKPLGKVDVDSEGGERTLVPSSASGSAETLPGSAMGTPAYMSPEQACGDLDRLGPRSDVYALGATLYCLLTGRPPFEGADIGEVLREVQRGGFAAPRQLDPSIDPALEAICMKAMATRSEDRYASCRALSDELERWSADEPVAAWREPFVRRARRWARRNRTAVTSLAASLLVALAGTAAVLAVQTRANGRLEKSNSELSLANGRVTQANADLKSANNREKERFALAMDAIGLFHGEVSGDLLMKEKPFEGLRTKLLKGAAAFYGRLEDLLKGQTDRESRAALGKAYEELGALTAKIGDQTAALVVRRKALAVRRALASEPGANAATKLDLARSLYDTGWLLKSTGDLVAARSSYEEARRLAEEAQTQGGAAEQAREVLGRAYYSIAAAMSETGDTAGALASNGRALAIQQKLADDNPGVMRFQQNLASSHYHVGLLLSETGDSPGALAAYNRALAIQQRLADADPKVTESQQDLARSHNNIGVLLAQTGDPAGALTAWNKSLAIQQALADATPTVTKFQLELATSHNNLGLLLAMTGDPAKARAAHDEALDIRQKLADANPGVMEFQQDVASSHNNIGGLLLETGDPAGALAAYARSLAIRQKLADANPNVTQVQLDLTISYNNTGIVLVQTGDKAGALAAWNKALAIRQKLADANPKVTRFAAGLARTLDNIGGLLSETGDPTGALAAHRRALAIQQKLADADPGMTEFQQDVAISHNNIGLLLAQAGDPAGAHASYDRALVIRQKLADANPGVTELQQELGITHNSVGLLLAQTGDPAGAQAAYGRALTIRQKLADANPKVARFQTALASSLRGRGLARLGLADRAGAATDTRRALEIWDALPSHSGGDRFESACCHATLAGLAGTEARVRSAGDRASEADKAMALLKEAVAMGERSVDKYRDEPALDGLRSRADFQLLLLDLAMPSHPFAR